MRTFFQIFFAVHTEERISKFYDDLKNLKLKRPVAEITRKTGISKGYVSEVLSKEKEPSENFLRLFYQKFIDNPENDDYELPLGDLRVTLKDYVDLLKEQTRKAEEREKQFIEIIKGKLTKIETNSKEIADDISALTNENQAAHRALMDSVDIAARQPTGTTRAAAGIVELASQEKHVKKGKKVAGR